MMIRDYKHLIGLQHTHTEPAVTVCESKIRVVKDLFVKKYVDCPFYGEIVLKQ